MRVLGFCFILFYNVFNIVAQTEHRIEETNEFLSLDVHKAHNTKRIKFYKGEKIVLKIKNHHKKYKGNIVSLSDTALALDNDTVVLYKNIEKIIINNSTSFTKVAKNFLKAAGGGYIFLDILNNVINSSIPLINPRTIVIGVTLIATGQVIRLLSIKRYKINTQNRIKFIDDNP